MATFGETMRRERELRDIALREVSESTKIAMRYLEALERDDFRHLPGGVFNRGFVRAYAQYIGIDPDAMVDAYLQEERQQNEKNRETSEARQQTIGTAARVDRASPGRGARRGGRLWLAAGLVAVVVLLVWALVFVALRAGFPPRWLHGSGSPETAAAPQPAATATSRAGWETAR